MNLSLVKHVLLVIVINLFFVTTTCFAESHVQADSQTNLAEWTLRFSDPKDEPWQNNWFVDGLIGKVSNTKQGLKVEAGPEAKNDAHHIVLWTKQQFSGDIKIEYDFTKIDDQLKMVNILYIQASGLEGVDQDISTWADERQIPSMNLYFKHMKLLHISYAAYGQTNDVPSADYVRARAYPLHPKLGFKGMEVPPSYYQTGLFKKGVVYKIVVEKNQHLLSFSVCEKHLENSKPKIFTWLLPKRGQVEFGRIGLRQMYTRKSIYNNFKVYTR